jgi:hypothetical protein
MAKVYTDQLFDIICNSIATSSKGLAEICKENGTSPRTFYKWVQDDIKLMHKYTRAREEQADYLADEILKLSDDKSGDLQDGEFGSVGNAANIQRSRLQVEARKWVAAKLKPKKYGDKVEVENTGELKIVANFGSTIIQPASESETNS